MSGNVVLITGGGSGIGRGLAEALHSLRNTIIITGRREDPLKDTATANPGMQYVVADVDDPDAIRNLAKQVFAVAPDLNVLINNAGMQRPEDLTIGDIAVAESTITTNLLGPIRMTAAFLPTLLRQPHGAVVNVSSSLAFSPIASIPTYCATKAGLHSYTQSLRTQLERSSVEVIEIIPPWVQTGLQGDHGFHPAAMPLAEYVSKVIRVLSENADTPEVIVN